MNPRFRFSALFLAALFVMLSLVSLPASASPALAGSYKITGNVDLGSEIRLSVELSFFNPGDTAVTVTRVSLRGIATPNQFVSASTDTVVPSRANAHVSLEFIVAKKDFSAWSVGPHQQFLVTLQPTGGKVIRSYVPLLRTKE